MPTYDYVCEACGHAFEHFQAMTDRLRRTCPKCGKRRLVRRIGAGAGLIFKGSGFYATDYKKSGGRKGGESGDSAEGSSGSSGSSDSSGAGGSGSKAPSEGASKPDAGRSAKTDAKPRAPRKDEKD